jgi:hypothetical protein
MDTKLAGDSDILPASDAVQLSALPLSDKPVMLSFNKGAMSKSEYAATSQCLCPVFTCDAT